MERCRRVVGSYPEPRMDTVVAVVVVEDGLDIGHT
jgi:hypothetical protein